VREERTEVAQLGRLLVGLEQEEVESRAKVAMLQLELRLVALGVALAVPLRAACRGVRWRTSTGGSREGGLPERGRGRARCSVPAKARAARKKVIK
jgi:hypothetical protein